MFAGKTRIYAATAPIDLRRSVDGLAAAARDQMGHDPQSGSLFLFVNRRATRLKALWFDHNGFCVLYKRLHRAVFDLPAPSGSSNAIQINAARLALLRGIARDARRKNRHREQHAA